MRLETKGLIIREQTVGENDRLVTIITEESGVLKAFVRGAKKINSKLSATSLFCYCDFSLFQGKDAYIVDEASPIDVFFGLRKDILSLTLAQYFAQLAFDFAEEHRNSKELLRLVLNSLHLMCKGNKPYNQIKATVEFRMLSLGGYMPNLLGCNGCGLYESETMFFDINAGCFNCESCNKSGGVPLNNGVFTAIRYICLSDIQKVFSFSLNDESMAALADVAEKYMLSRANKEFSTLTFYKSLL